MRHIVHYAKLIAPALLVIFILGSKPAKVKGQEPAKKEKKTYAIKVVKEEDGNKIVLDTTFTWMDEEGLAHTLLDLNLEDLDLEDLGGEGIMMKVKETDDGHAYVYCFSSTDEDGKSKARGIAKTICMEKDGVWTISSDEDGDMKLIVKSKKDGESEADIYIVKSGSRNKKKKK